MCSTTIRQVAYLYSGSESHHLVGVHGHVRILASQLLHNVLHGGDTGGSSHKDDLVDVLDGQLGVPKGVLYGDAAPEMQKDAIVKRCPQKSVAQSPLIVKTSTLNLSVRADSSPRKNRQSSQLHPPKLHQNPEIKP